MFNKKYLIKYERPKGLSPLRDYFEYILHIEVIWFGGLFKTTTKRSHKIFSNEPLRVYFDHWDRMISERKPISKQ